MRSTSAASLMPAIAAAASTVLVKRSKAPSVLKVPPPLQRLVTERYAAGLVPSRRKSKSQEAFQDLPPRLGLPRASALQPLPVLTSAFRLIPTRVPGTSSGYPDGRAEGGASGP